MTAGETATSRPAPRRLPRAWLAIAFVLPLALLAGWVLWITTLSGGGASATAARIGAAAPDFALTDLDGNPVRLADFRGRPVIVNFWASWCVPCVDEFPLLQSAATEHGDDGLAIIGIVYRDNSEAVRQFMDRMGADWQTAMDPDEAVAQRYAIFGPPESFFIDADGVIRGRQIGQLSASDLDRQLGLILTGSSQ